MPYQYDLLYDKSEVS